MKITHTAIAASLGGALMFAGASTAAPLVEESFDYEVGGINGLSGGTGFSGNWDQSNSAVNVAAPGLTWGTLDVSGNRANGGAFSAANRPIGTTLSTAGLLNDGATLWFSVIFGLDGQNVANADINFALTNAGEFSGSFGDRENLVGATSQGIGVSHSRGNIEGVYWTDLDAGADSVAERTEADTTLSIGGGTVEDPNPQYALLVGKIDWGTGTGDESLTLYAPDLNLNLGTAILTWTDIPNLNQTTFDNLALQFKDTPQLDEIRFGATSADVLPVPEPGSLALLGLGGLLIARRRRG